MGLFAPVAAPLAAAVRRVGRARRRGRGDRGRRRAAGRRRPGRALRRHRARRGRHRRRRHAAAVAGAGPDARPGRSGHRALHGRAHRRGVPRRRADRAAAGGAGRRRRRRVLAVWAVPAAVALVDLARPDPPVRRPPAPGGRVEFPWRRRAAWLGTLFMGLQSLLFYATLAWLAATYTGLGLSAHDAGLLLAAVQRDPDRHRARHAGTGPPQRRHPALDRRSRSASPRSGWPWWRPCRT